MNDPFISLIIPVYNVREYIEQCLDSVIAQDYENFEILLVDDGSTDGSEAVCDSYADKDPRIKVFHTEKKGLSCARNIALDAAQGEYISFLDSDDWMEPGLFRKFTEYTEKYDQDIIVFRYTFDYRDCVKDPFRKSDNDGSIRILKDKDILPAYLTEYYIKNVVWNKIYRKNCFSGIRFPEGRIYEDISVMYRVLENVDTLVCAPDYLYHYRQRPGSLTSNNDFRTLRDYWTAYYERLETLKNKYPELRYHLISGCILAAVRLWTTYNSLSRDEKSCARSLMSEIRTFMRENREYVKAASKMSGMVGLLSFFGWRNGVVITTILRMFKIRK